MSSEELRLDLESFINKGLERGVRGWPVKGRERALAGCGGQRLRELAAAGLGRRLWEETTTRAFEVVRWG